MIDPYWARSYECGRRRSLGFFVTEDAAHEALADRIASRAKAEDAYTQKELRYEEDDRGDSYLEAKDHYAARSLPVPEAALWAAIILQALQDIRSEDGEVRRGAMEWIMGDDVAGAWAVDFPTACAVLGLDLAATRERVSIQRAGAYVNMGSMAL